VHVSIAIGLLLFTSIHQHILCYHNEMETESDIDCVYTEITSTVRSFIIGDYGASVWIMLIC